MTGTRRRWIVSFWSAFALAFAAIQSAVYGSMERAEIEAPSTNLDAAAGIQDTLLRGFPRAEEPPDMHRVAFLGDSVMASYPVRRRVDDRLGGRLRRLARDRASIRVIPLARPGMGPFDHYFLADQIVAIRPTAVVCAFNVASLSDAWRRNFVRPELSGWISVARLGEALRLPLYWIGLTADRLLLYMGLARGVPFDAWHFVHRQQARVGQARSDLVERVGELVGNGAESRFATAHDIQRLNEAELVDRKRFKALGLRRHYGVALAGAGPDHPVIQMLAAGVRAFREAGIPTLVFITPLDTEYMDSLGLYDPEGVGRTIRSVEEVVRTAGGEFVDLHRLLGDEAFRDAPGHLVYEGDIDGPDLLAEALAPSVLEILMVSQPTR